MFSDALGFFRDTVESHERASATIDLIQTDHPLRFLRALERVEDALARISSCEPTMTRVLLRSALLWLAVALLSAAAPEEFDVRVDAGNHDRRESLVILPLPPEAEKWRTVTLREVATDQATPVQVIRVTDPSVAFFIRDLKAHSSRLFRVTRVRKTSSRTSPNARASTTASG